MSPRVIKDRNGYALTTPLQALSHFNALMALRFHSKGSRRLDVYCRSYLVWVTHELWEVNLTGIQMVAWVTAFAFEGPKVVVILNIR